MWKKCLDAPAPIVQCYYVILLAPSAVVIPEYRVSGRMGHSEIQIHLLSGMLEAKEIMFTLFFLTSDCLGA